MHNLSCISLEPNAFLSKPYKGTELPEILGSKREKFKLVRPVLILSGWCWDVLILFPVIVEDRSIKC